MNMAVFFQKYNKNLLVKVLRKLYLTLMVRGNNQRIRFLINSGAKIGNGVIVRDVECLGSEPYLVEIGDNTSFSSGVRIVTHDGSVARLFYMGLTSKKYDVFGKIKIGKNCFVGMNSLILKNVTVGDNCIIGAGTVVTKSIPSNSIVAGVPARIIGTVEDFSKKNSRYFDDTIALTPYNKRKYITEHIDIYESVRKEQENSNSLKL